MSLEDRDWYRKDYKKRHQNDGKKYQEFYDAAWSEVENTHKTIDRKTVKREKQVKDNSVKNQEKIVISIICGNCMNTVQVRLPKRIPYQYHFSCPKCRKVTFVKTQHPQRYLHAVLDLVTILIGLYVPFLLSICVENYLDKSYGMIIVSIGINFVLLLLTYNRRKHNYDRGVLNTLAMIVSTFAMAYSVVQIGIAILALYYPETYQFPMEAVQVKMPAWIQNWLYNIR